MDSQRENPVSIHTVGVKKVLYAFLDNDKTRVWLLNHIRWAISEGRLVAIRASTNEEVNEHFSKEGKNDE